MIICIAEDRPQEEPGVKLLLKSLAHHCPGVAVRLSFPPGDQFFWDWVDSQPLHIEPLANLPTGQTYNVKVEVLLQALEIGHDEVWWFDSDIILLQDFRLILQNLPVSTLVACEECYWGQHQGSAARLQGWGLSSGRELPVTINTGVIRVTPAHWELLQRWRALLADPCYRAAQQCSWQQRPIHLLGDQDVITALLASAEFAAIPLRLLRRGAEIIQYFGPGGYTVTERLQALTQAPPLLVHAMGSKPWHFPHATPPGAGLRHHYDALAAELSPHRVATQRLGATTADFPWLSRHSRLGRLLDWLGGGNLALTGLPLAALDSSIRQLRRWLGIGRIKTVTSPSPTTDADQLP